MRRTRAVCVAIVSYALGVGGSAFAATFLFSGEANRLNVYDITSPQGTPPKRTLIPSEADQEAGNLPRGEDINAQICFFKKAGKTFFIAGEDTNQNPADPQGWGVFQLTGHKLDKLDWKQHAKLVPTYQASDDNAENYGCGLLSDGRLVLSDVGNQQPGRRGDGQLHVWFAGFEAPDPAQTFIADTGNGDPDFIGASSPSRYCKIDVAIATAGGIFVDEHDRVYVTQTRPQEIADNPLAGAGVPLPIPALVSDPLQWLPGVYRYSNLPTSAAQCTAGTDGVLRARLCGPCHGSHCPPDCVKKELVVLPNPITLTPSAVAGSRHGTMYVSSVLNGTIAEYTLDGVPLQLILGPGLPLGPLGLGGFTLQSPTPYGIAVAPDGSAVYFADLGVVLGQGGLAGPGDMTGRLGRVPLLGGIFPKPARIIDAPLDFPDGVGVVVLP